MNNSQNTNEEVPQILHDLWESAQGKPPRITKFKALQAIEAYYAGKMVEAKQKERERILNWNPDEVYDAIKHDINMLGTIKLVIDGKESVFDLTGKISMLVLDRLKELKSQKVG